MGETNVHVGMQQFHLAVFVDHHVAIFVPDGGIFHHAVVARTEERGEGRSEEREREERDEVLRDDQHAFRPKNDLLVILFDESLRSDFQSGDVGVLIENMEVVEWRNAVDCKEESACDADRRETLVLPPLIFGSVMFFAVECTCECV